MAAREGAAAWARLAPLCLGLALTACRSGCAREVFPVQRATVRSVNAVSSDAIAPPVSEVEAALRRTLERHGGFRWSGPREEGAVRLEAEVVFRDPEASRPAPAEPQVGVLLTLRIEDERFETEAWRSSGANGLSSALSDAVASGYARLVAQAKSDRALLQDAASGSAADKHASVAELVRRRNPAAEKFLLEQLRSNDGLEVRRAIGGLVELRRTSSVPALIELTLDRDPGFLRELIFALGVIGGEEARAYLFTVAQGHDQPAIRESAQQALRELERRPSREPSLNQESTR